MVADMRESTRIDSLILAAGAGTRFGSRKQLAELNGLPLLRHAVNAALRSVTRATIVVLGAYAAEISSAVDLTDVRTVFCEDWASGRGASLRAGIAAVQANTEAVIVTLGDEPFLDPAAIDRMCAARGPGRSALRASYGGRAGHPVLIERALFTRVAQAGANATPAAALRDAGIVEIECGDLNDPDDVDTLEQLRALGGAA